MSPGPPASPAVRAAMLASVDAVFAGVRRYRDAASIARDHAAFLDEQLAWCTDRDRAARRATSIGVGTPDDFLNRVLEVGGERVLAGLRHDGGDPARPFVDVLAWTGRLDVPATVAAAIAAWRSVDVPRVRLPEAADAPLDGGPLALAGDMVAVAGSLAEMLDAPTPAGLDRVTLADADPGAATDFMEAAYADLRRRDPDLADRVPPSTRDALDGCRTDGRLVFWHVGGERAGLLAVSRQTGWLALDGWIVEEEVVDPAWAGRGSAAAAQRRLAERLLAEGEDPGLVIAGTIDEANLPSLRTAARAGRRAVAGWRFAPADGTASSTAPSGIARPERDAASPV